MKPYDKSDSFMRRVTKRVSELIPGKTWMNTLLGESQSGNDLSLTNESNDQPPVKKLCTSNNTFATANNRMYVDTNTHRSSVDNHKNQSNINAVLPEISAINCVPSTSRQSPKFINQTNSSLPCNEASTSNRSSLKRKSEMIDLSNINRPIPKTLNFNFASSTPTVTNKLPVTNNSKRSLNTDKLSMVQDFLTSTSSNLTPRENESQSLLMLREKTSKKPSSPSFRWDTFVDYGELSERQKLFALKSPLNCSQVMYGGSSARSNLSKILGSTPPIHKKAVISISPTNNNEIRTTSSILLGHISTKDKKIEENTFIIQPKGHLRHKAEPKNLPITVETTIKSIDTVSEKSNNISRDISRKLRANISKKTRGLTSEEHEMPSKVDLPNITLPVPILPSINLFNNCEDNEFTFNQPLTIEQFSLQIAEKTSKKQQKITSLRTMNSNSNSKSSNLCPTITNPTHNSIDETKMKEPGKITIPKKDENLNNNDKILEIPKYENDFKNSISKSLENPSSILESIKSDETLKMEESNNTNKEHEKSPVELKKWVCDACWVSNDSEKNNCVACQTPKSGKSQKPLKIAVSSTWTCETCWVPNKNEVNACVACQTQKPGSSNKVTTQSGTWTCDACWVKNKVECTSCISCGTGKPGIVLENKNQQSTQFKFGMNNNTTENSASGQFKFGFNNDKTNNVTSQFKFGSSTFNNSANDKSGDMAAEFKFGMVNNKTDQPFNTFKFGIDNSLSQPEKKIVDVSNNSNTEQSKSQFNFGLEKKSDPSESQFNFGLNASSNKSISQFKFSSDNVVTDKSKPNLEDSSKSITKFKFSSDNVVTENSKQNMETVNILKSTNDLNELVNKNEMPENQVESQSKKNLFKFGDAKADKLIPQVSFNNIENPLINDIGPKNDNLKEKIVQNPINFGSSQTVQSTISNPNQLVNGHSHSNEEQKPNLIKTSQLFSFGSLAKQDQVLPNDQKMQKPFTFGSTTNDKPFVPPTINCFPNTGPVFGTGNTMFGSGPTTSTPSTLSLSVPTPQFSFGSIAPSTTTNSIFSMTSNDNDKTSSAQTSTSFTTITNTGFTFGAQSPPVFNAGGFIKSVQANDQSINISNNIFNPSSAKQIIKSTDPKAPISINFTGGATTQFTAKPETTEQPPKRKILKPVRRIR